MFLRNCWYVAAWDHEIDRDALFERTLLGDSVLFYRTASGTIVALDNRCCHRHAPLSLGRKEGDCVRCMYHGLKYDATGRCVEIPGQSAIPSSLKLRKYPTVTIDGWIWIWMGDSALADASLIPRTPALSEPGWPGTPGYLHYKANHLLISDNLLDFSHLSYVHEATLGGSEQIAETPPEIERLARGVKITRKIPRTVLAPFQREFMDYSGFVDRYFVYEYLVPGILLMESGVHAVDTDDTCTMDFKSSQAITPETTDSTHYFFVQGRNFMRDDPRVSESLFNSICRAFEEDRRMVEGQHAMIANSNRSSFVLLRFDLALSHFRKIMSALLAAETEANAKPEARDLEHSRS